MSFLALNRLSHSLTIFNQRPRIRRDVAQRQIPAECEACFHRWPTFGNTFADTVMRNDHPLLDERFEKRRFKTRKKLPREQGQGFS